MDTPDTDPAPEACRSGGRLAVVAGAAFVIALAVYWPCLDHGFLRWDDEENIVENEAYRGLTPRHLWWMFTTTHMGPYQPLSWVSLGLDYCLWGLNPRGYHLTSVVLHAISAALMVWVTASILAARRARRGPDGRAPSPAPLGWPVRWALPLGALGAGLLWAVHPQRVESVAWVTERRDVMCGLFYLLCIASYLRGHEPDRPDRSRERWLWGARACCLLALLSKAAAVSLPVVLVVLDVSCLGRLTGPVTGWWRRSARDVLLEKSSYVFFSLFAIAVGLWGQWQGGGLQPLDRVGLVDRLAIAAYALVFYLTKQVAPVGLSPMYSRPVPLDLVSWRFLGSAASVLAITAVLITLRRRWPTGLAAWAGYVAMVLPVSGLVTIGHELVADRYSYLPSLAVVVLAGGVLAWALQRSRSGGGRAALVLPTAVVVAVLAFVTRALIPVWHDDVALWERAVLVNPDSARAQANLGGIYALTGRDSDAAESLSKAIALGPDEPEPHYNLGLVLRSLGRRDEALAAFDAAIRLQPNHVEAWRWRGVTLLELGRTQEAVVALRRAIGLAPSMDVLRIRLAQAYVAQEDYPQAIATYQDLLRADAPSPEAYAGLAEVHLRRGEPERAEAVLSAAPAAIAGSPEVGYAMARVRAGQGRVPEALALLRRVLTASPPLRAKARLDPLLGRVRDDDRFEDLLAEIEVDLARQRRAPFPDGLPR